MIVPQPPPHHTVTDPGMYAGMFESSSLEEVNDALGVAQWMLREGRDHQNHIPATVLNIQRLLVQEAAAELHRRQVVPQTMRGHVDLDQIKDRLDLPGFIRHRAPSVDFRQQAGGRMVCRCPFGTHDDSSASFTVFPAPDPHWYCFGCCLGGSVIDFELHWTHDDLRTVIGRLAWEAGVERRTPDQPTPIQTSSNHGGFGRLRGKTSSVGKDGGFGRLREKEARVA